LQSGYKSNVMVIVVSRGKWDRRYKNDFPDAAFIIIEKGGRKDRSGRTVPRGLPHLPHHNQAVKHSTDDKTINKAHLRHALARLNLTDISAQARKRTENHLPGHTRRLGID